MGDNVEKLKKIRKLHLARNRQRLKDTKVEQTSLISEQDKMLLEVAAYSNLPIDDKLLFLWDVLSSEFDSDETSERYDAYLKIVLELLDNVFDI